METSLEYIKKKYFSHVPDRISGLVDLSYNLWWSWSPEAKMVFKQLNVHAWIESVHNPVKMIRNLPVELLERAAKNPQYLRHYDLVMERFVKEMHNNNKWFTEQTHFGRSLPVAYFSAEYGLHHSLPFYAGGLGFLAGDHLKECSDLGVPMVAVGFMYGEGYLHQHIRSDGWQDDIQETLDRDAAPVTRIMANHDKQLIIKVPFIDPPIYVAVWKVDVGRVPLYLMDTDIDKNESTYRSIFSRLYIGDPEWRLRQEIVLGIGGSEILDKLEIEHSITHLNEGHTAFVLLERLRKRVEAGASFEEAVHQIQGTSIFTTHTPVLTGHDRYPASLMDKYFSDYYPLLKLDRKRFFQLGFNPADSHETFNMTALAMRLSGYRNAVSREHGIITRRMWNPLWAEVSIDQVPIDHITNGVHLPTWLDPKMELLFSYHLGRYYSKWLEDHDSPTLWHLVDEIPDRELWQVHQSLKRQLFNRIREYKRWKWLEGEAEPINVVAGGMLLDPNALTIGFARRFTSYKRADLIFSDIERLKRLVNNWWRPVQIIFAGKAHPADVEGKKILQKIYSFTQRPDFGGRIAFVEDYGEQIAQYLVHGVDLWLNTPIRAMEASGTSGMKASMNGVLHLSIPTGWWVEGYNGKNGWIIGSEASEEGEDRDDAQKLYEILENEVVPLYYTVSEDGTPHPWIKMMKEAIKSTAPHFSARRMVKEYIKRYYIHALKSCGEKCYVN